MKNQLHADAKNTVDYDYQNDEKWVTIENIEWWNHSSIGHKF